MGLELRFGFVLDPSPDPNLTLTLTLTPAAWGAWRGRLARYDLTPPPGTHIISSVPGRHTSDRYGYRALERYLRAEIEPRGHVVARVEYASSSIGKLDVATWPAILRAMLPVSTCVQDAAGDRARAERVRIVWPSLGTTIAWP